MNKDEFENWVEKMANPDKLQEIVSDRFRDLVRESPRRKAYDPYVKNKWRILLDSMGIETSNGWAPEGFVLIRDPNPLGNWLKMDKETALKIRVLGMP